MITLIRKNTTQNENGVTPVLSYTILLGVTVILISLVLLTFSAFETTQKEQTTQNEITLVLSNITAELHYIDREASNSTYQEFSQESRATPRYIAQRGYSIELQETSTTNIYEITIASESPNYEQTQEIYIESNVELRQGVVRDDLTYTYNPSTDTIIIE